MLTPATVSLALRVRELAPEHATGPTSTILWVGALVALLGNPIFGALSDRTKSRYGRRRPYLVGGVLLGLVSLGLIATATSLRAVLFGWCAAQLAYNAAVAAMVAIVPDRIPAEQRGTVVGILGVCVPVGQIAGTFLVQELSGSLTAALWVPGVIAVFGVLLLVTFLPDAPLSASPVASRTAVPASTPGGPSYVNFGFAWLSRAFFVTGSVFLQAYQPFLLIDGLGFTAAEVPRLIFRTTLTQAVAVMLCSVLAGRLSDQLGRRKVFAVTGAVVQGIGLWLIAVAPSYPAFLAGVGLMGMGHGVYEGVNLALVTEVLPDRAHRAAKDLGILNIANTLPQVVAPLTGPVLLAMNRANDYFSMFVVAGALTMLGAVMLVPVRGVR